MKIEKCTEVKSDHQTATLPLQSAHMLDLGSIASMVDYRFKVLDRYVDVSGLATFVVVHEPMKQKFQDLLRDLANHNLSARVQGVSGKLVISVFPRPKAGKPRKKINLILLVATIATVAFASYSLIFNVDPRITSVLFRNVDLRWQAVLLTLSIMGIFAVHETGHVLAVRHHKMDASLPYFVPAPPPILIGTFGAVIVLRGPPGNRDQLFDLGFSGPIAGFLAMIVVALFAYLTAPLISEQQAASMVASGLLTNNGWPPLFMQLLSGLPLRTVPPGQTLVLTQLSLAAEIGALMTFLNLLPVWQLDGGHIARATLGNRGHKLMLLVGFGILALGGSFGFPAYYGFALLLLGFMFLSRRPLQGLEPLDDVSPLSASRRFLFCLTLAMLLLTFVILPI